MGIFKAISASISETSENIYRGFYYCDSLSSDILIQRGVMHVTENSDNHYNNPNIIPNGSIISVNDGQAAIIVSSGKVTAYFTEPGEHILEKGGNASLFTKHGLADTVTSTIDKIGFGGDYRSTQRLYYVNTKEILGIPFSTLYAIPFRIVDSDGGVDIDASLYAAGTLCLRVTRPDILYKNVTGNVLDNFPTDRLIHQIHPELSSELANYLGSFSDQEYRLSDLPSLQQLIGDNLAASLTQYLEPLRGISVTKLSIATLYIEANDTRIIKELQKNKAYAGAFDNSPFKIQTKDEYIAKMNEKSKKSASSKSYTSIFDSIGALYAAESDSLPAPKIKTGSGITRLSWTCSCGTQNTGKFCVNCGAKGNLHWRCSCGHENSGKFCEECGAKFE